MEDLRDSEAGGDDDHTLQWPAPEARQDHDSGTEEEEYNPDYENARLANDQTLKHRFEAIFEKYGRDFSGIGDEIDMSTGDVVVDNGHLANMEHEGDPGRDVALSSRLMREFTNKLEHEDDLRGAEVSSSLGSSSEDDGDDDDEMDDDEEDDQSESDSTLFCQATEHHNASRGLDATGILLPRHESDLALDPALRDNLTPAASLFPETGVRRTDVIERTASSASASGTSSDQRSLEESDSTDTPINVLAMPAVQESMYAMKHKARGGMTTKDIEALGMSIANQIAKFIGVGKKRKRSKRKDTMWDYPELPVDKRRRTDVRPQRPSLPQPTAAISPARRKSVKAARESIWAPLHHPQPRRSTWVKPVLSHQVEDEASAMPDDADVSSHFIDEVYETAEGITLKKCYHCKISATTCWRRGPDGDLCNACGMYWYRYQLMKPLREPTPPESEYDDSEAEEEEPEETAKEPQYKANTSRRLTKHDPGSKYTRFTVEEDALIIKLKEIDKLTWEMVGRHFPDRTTYAVQFRYSKNLTGLPSEGRDALIEQGFTFDRAPEVVAQPEALESEDEELMRLHTEDGLDFATIAERMPGRTAEALEARFRSLLSAGPQVPKVVPRPRIGLPKRVYTRFTAEEDALLVKLREVDKLAWDLIAKRVPGRTELALQKRYVRELSRRKQVIAKGEVDPFEYVLKGEHDSTGLASQCAEQDYADNETLQHENEGSSELPPPSNDASISEPKVINPNAAALRIANGSRASKLRVDTPARYRTRYNKAEDQLILRLRLEDKMDWDAISLRMPGRSAHALSVRWQQKLQYDGTFQLDDSDAVSNAESVLEEALDQGARSSAEPEQDQIERPPAPLAFSAEAIVAYASQQVRYGQAEPAGSSLGSTSQTDDSVISHDPYQFEEAAPSYTTQESRQRPSDDHAYPYGMQELQDDVSSFADEEAGPSKSHPHWSHEEHDFVIQQRSQGQSWAAIASRMPGRTSKALRCHWSAHKRKVGESSTAPKRKSDTSLLRRALDNGIRRRSESFVSVEGMSGNPDGKDPGRKDATPASISRDVMAGNKSLLPSPMLVANLGASSDSSAQPSPTKAYAPESVEGISAHAESPIHDTSFGTHSSCPGTPIQTYDDPDETRSANSSYITPARYSHQAHPYYAPPPLMDAWLPIEKDHQSRVQQFEPDAPLQLDPALFQTAPNTAASQKAAASEETAYSAAPPQPIADELSDDDMDVEGQGDSIKTPQPLPDLDIGGGRPPFSWTELITMALKSAPGQRAVPVDICNYLEEKFPYFKTCGVGWKNTLRGMLSSSKDFAKVQGEKSKLWGFAEQDALSLPKRRAPKDRSALSLPHVHKPEDTGLIATSRSHVAESRSQEVPESRLEPNHGGPKPLVPTPSREARANNDESRAPHIETVSRPVYDPVKDCQTVSPSAETESDDAAFAEAVEELPSAQLQGLSSSTTRPDHVTEDAPVEAGRALVSSDVYRDPESSPATMHPLDKIEQLRRLLNEEDFDSSDDEPIEVPTPPKHSSPVFTHVTAKQVTPVNVYSKGARTHSRTPTTIWSHLAKTPGTSVKSSSKRDGIDRTVKTTYSNGVGQRVVRQGSRDTPILIDDEHSEDELAL